MPGGQPNVLQDGRYADKKTARRLIWIGAESPARSARLRAMSALARSRRHSRMVRWAGPSLASPASGSSEETGIAPGARHAWPERALALAARDQVLGRQLVDGLAHRALAHAKAWASSISLGMASPGFHSPCCRLCRSAPLICWYSGLKAEA